MSSKPSTAENLQSVDACSAKSIHAKLLEFVADHNKLTFLKYLIEEKKMDNANKDLLLYATRHNKLDIIKYLIAVRMCIFGIINNTIYATRTHNGYFVFL